MAPRKSVPMAPLRGPRSDGAGGPAGHGGQGGDVREGTGGRAGPPPALAFLSPELSKWDLLADVPGGPPELIALPFFADERPLRGAAGLVDWRLCGRLSRLLLAGRVMGSPFETTLLPAQRLPFKKLLLFGLGQIDRFDEVRYRESVAELRQVIARLGVRRYALALPGRATGHIMARRALELWLEAGGGDGEAWLIEPQSAQKEMSEVLGKGGRRG